MTDELPGMWEHSDLTGGQTDMEPTAADRLYDLDIRLAAIEKLLTRIIPLVEMAERYLAMTPLERVRASLRKPL